MDSNLLTSLSPSTALCNSEMDSNLWTSLSPSTTLCNFEMDSNLWTSPSPSTTLCNSEMDSNGGRNLRGINLRLYDVILYPGCVEEQKIAHAPFQYQVFRGLYGGEIEITARLYTNYKFAYNPDCISEAVMCYDYSNVLNYKGYAVIGAEAGGVNMVYYIYETYLFRLCDIERSVYPLVEISTTVPYQGEHYYRVTGFGRSIYRCFLGAIDELRENVSMHQEFNAEDVVITSISGSVVFAKIIIRPFQLVDYYNDRNEQIFRDMRSVGQVHHFILGGNRTAEGEDLWIRLFRNREYRPGAGNDVLLHVFARNALAILRHPWFWVPSEDIYFLQKVGGLLSDKLKGVRDGPGQKFKDIINQCGITKWKDILPDDPDLAEDLRGAYENESCDFAIGIRHLTVHYTKNNKVTQKNLQDHPWPFLIKFINVDPFFMIVSYNAVEVCFVREGIGSAYDLDEYVERSYFNDCLM